MARSSCLLLLLVFPGCLRMGFGSNGPDDASETGQPGKFDSAEAYSRDHEQGVIAWRAWEVPCEAEQSAVVWLTLEARRGGYLQPLRIEGNVAYPSAVAIPLPSGAWVRGIGVDPQGRLLIGNGVLKQVLRVDVSREPAAIEELLLLPGPPDIGDTHGICSLPGGNLVAGEYGAPGGNLVVELALAGRELSPLDIVHSTSMPADTLSVCQATSDDEIYLTDYEGITDQNGDVLHLVREGGRWIERARFDVSAFDLLQSGAENNSAIFAFVVHSDGFLYALPMRRFGERLKRLIRCPAGDIRADKCVQLGELPADRSSVINDVDAIQGAAELPGGDLLFATNGALYRYLLAEDRCEQLFDLGALELADDAGSDQLFVTRGLVITRDAQKAAHDSLVVFEPVTRDEGCADQAASMDDVPLFSAPQNPAANASLPGASKENAARSSYPFRTANRLLEPPVAPDVLRAIRIRLELEDAARAQPPSGNPKPV